MLKIHPKSTFVQIIFKGHLHLLTQNIIPLASFEIHNMFWPLPKVKSHLVFSAINLLPEKTTKM